jgi:NAD(P)H dehydrogenase (quinone)
MFAVTAITGKVGSIVADTLLKAGRQVRAVARDEVKGERWRARGCEVAVANISDAAQFTAALGGTEGAFILLPPVFDPEPGFPEAKASIAVVRQAVQRAAPPKAVVLSSIGADAVKPNLLNSVRFLEEALADLPTPITFLRAAWFMENAEWDLASARDRGVIESYLQPLDRPVPMVSAVDVGRTAAEILTEDWSGHRIVELEAPGRVTPNAIAAAFGKALKRTVRAEIAPRANWERIFRSPGHEESNPAHADDRRLQRRLD